MSHDSEFVFRISAIQHDTRFACVLNGIAHLLSQHRLHHIYIAEGIQSLARRLHPGFKAEQQQDAAEFTDFLFSVLDVCVRVASGPDLPVGQLCYAALQQVECSCIGKVTTQPTTTTSLLKNNPDSTRKSTQDLGEDLIMIPEFSNRASRRTQLLESRATPSITRPTFDVYSGMMLKLYLCKSAEDPTKIRSRGVDEVEQGTVVIYISQVTPSSSSTGPD